MNIQKHIRWHRSNFSSRFLAVLGIPDSLSSLRSGLGSRFRILSVPKTLKKYSAAVRSAPSAIGEEMREWPKFIYALSCWFSAAVRRPEVLTCQIPIFVPATATSDIMPTDVKANQPTDVKAAAITTIPEAAPLDQRQHSISKVPRLTT